MDDYRRVADAVAADIAAGRLRPGDRLPPQRAFARERGIAPSTAGRVYRELALRGLTVGEVGRGTFVRAAGRAPVPALAEPAAAPADLEVNHPVVPGQEGLMAPGLARAAASGAALVPAGVAGTPDAREAAAALLAVPGWTPAPGGVLFAAGGRQAIAGAVAALVPPGGRLAVEELTYPVLKATAARLGVALVPVASDEHGLCPDALAEAHRRTPFAAVYLQPTLHNPCGTTMPARRRAEVADVLERTDARAIEDRVWSFLDEVGPPPLASFAPARTIVVDGLAKRLAPGLGAGFAVAPPPLYGRVAAALRSGTWGPAGYALAASAGWIADGTAAAVARAKRADAAERQRIAAKRLGGAALRADPRSYFCWWELPAPWRAETFVAAAGRRGIAVTPGAAFVAGPDGAPHAVRLALASPPLDGLARALGVLAEIAAGSPDDAPID
ncbi:aminotransferase-like domain-containing protein [Actinomadura algeriensis]|uniref:DNA-binding transcriptional MocR family regulator n=1 Tax=Actinomadura algeriensis TaxID=1679523 RepID=A0ABR9K011_9ACTN|nr:PLP-dependent aminotransferase family protein [Actinomadura algeriensis]MBE1536068.1 DNA-binding transcriptional MocR family regulator [Actinomadura algeriensis]